MNLKGLLKRYTVEQLQEAVRLRARLGRVEALEAKKSALMKQVAKIDRKLSKLNGSTVTATTPGKPRRKRWKLSAATRRKMSEAAKRRYAGKSKPDAPKPKPKKRTLSAAGRAAISAAAKARWERIRSAKAAPAKDAAP